MRFSLTDFLVKRIRILNIEQGALIIVFMLLIFMLPSILKDTGSTNLYIQQSNAFIEGDLAIDEDGFTYEAAKFIDKYYVSFPPGPAIVLTPFTFIANLISLKLKSTLVSLLISIVTVLLIYKLCRIFNVNPRYIFWICLAVIFGTGYPYVLFTSHYVYGFAHVCSLLFLFLFLTELFGRSNAVVLGFYLGFAFLCRQSTIFYFFLSSIWFFSERNDSKTKFNMKKKIVVFSSTVSIFVLFYLLLNYIRFDSPIDTGYKYISTPGYLGRRVKEIGLFSIQYLPYNFYSLFLKGFNLHFAGALNLKLSGVDLMGTSLVFSSPFLLFVFISKIGKNVLIAVLFCIVPILFIILLYYNNGFEQINTQRFSLDFLPLLIVLILKSVSERNVTLFKGLVVYSVLMNVFSYVIDYFT